MMVNTAVNKRGSIGGPASGTVIVVGGGVAGLAAACVFQQAGYATTVLEQGQRPETPDGDYDPRVSAFSPPSIELLRQLSAWPEDSARIQAYEGMHVWADGDFDSIAFSATEMGVPELGAIAENRLIQSALWKSAEQLGVKIIEGASWQELNNSETGVSLLLDSGEELVADWLVGADGAQSAVRNALAIERRGWKYQHHAIVCHIHWDEDSRLDQASAAHQNIAWQRFLATGPLALLPLADARSSLVWSLEQAKCTEMLALSDQEFVTELNKAIDGVGGLKAVAVSKRFSFPLALGQAQRYSAGRCLLVGDAAHGVHPLAGQGLNLGLMDVRDLSRTLSGAPLGQSVVETWQRRRRAKATEMMLLTEGLYRIFRVEQMVAEQGSALPNSFLKFAAGSFSRSVLSAGMALAGGSTVIRQQLARLALESDA